MYKIQSLLAVVYKSYLCVNVINCLTFKGHLFRAVKKILIDLLSVITLETGWILKVNMFHVTQ